MAIRVSLGDIYFHVCKEYYGIKLNVPIKKLVFLKKFDHGHDDICETIEVTQIYVGGRVMIITSILFLDKHTQIHKERSIIKIHMYLASYT